MLGEGELFHNSRRTLAPLPCSWGRGRGWGPNAERLGGYAMGPLRIGTNGRGFAAQDGTPFFWLGDTQWELFRCLSPADAAETMEIRKRQGFNVLQVMITGVGDGTAPNLDGQT